MTYNKNDWESHDLITTGKMNNIEDGIQTALERATFGHGGAELPSEGLHVNSYINLGDPMPPNPLSGDVVYVKDGDDYTVYQYDGTMWILQVDPKFSQRLEKNLLEAKAQTETLITNNQVNIDNTINEVKAEQENLQKGLDQLDTKAQGYADKALADAKADTLATATQTAKDASDALAKAKTDLTTSLNKEVTDRVNAVTALDTKAKGYADTAKADAISAGATADGVINKKIDDTASSITSTISQNKTDADGKITTAQSTATQALNGLATKVSQTVYDTKTGQLQTDLNTTTTTANQAKTDIVAIKSDNTKQDARMTTIESDANGTKTTVSNLQTDLGKANGSISTLQQRADGFDATVTKVNSLSVGGRNYVLNSNGFGDTNSRPKLIGASANWGGPVVTFPGDGVLLTNPTTHTSGEWFYEVATAWTSFTNTPLMPGETFSFSAEVMGTIPQAALRVGFKEGNSSFNTFDINNTTWTRVSIVVQSQPTNTGFYFRIQGASGGKINTTWAGGETLKFRNVKIEDGNMPTAWTPAPEDVDSATAKAQLTADNASLALSNYKTDADGRISKAQADIIVNANAITQKVSQSDYNAKTGDLTTKVNTAQSTADSATSTIGAYKTSNDARVASAESKITANATAITQKVSQTDYNTKTGQIDGQISTINQTAGKISQSVSDVKAQVDGLSVGGRNLFILSTASKGWLDMSYNVTAPGDASLASDFIPVTANTTYIAQQWYIMSHPTGGGWLRYAFYDSTKTPISRVPAPANNSATYSKWVITTPANATFIRMSFDYTANNGSKVKFEQGNLPTDWSPAPEDTDNKISTVSQTVDSISSIVSDPTTGLTKRVQTAEGSISTVQSNVSDLQSKQTQTANGLTTEISNRATGDTNTLTQAKDFTTSSITSSESGTKSLITQTSDAIIAQVSDIGVRYVRINGQGNQDNNGTHFMRVSLFDSSGTDLMLNKTATMSGPGNPTFGGNNGGNGATDGSVTTYAAIYPEPNLNNFMVYDLGAITYRAQRFEVKMWTSNRTYKGVTIQVSPDNKSWRTVLQEDVKAISNDVTKPDTTVNLGNTSSATQLALMKDNWSIGIADNTSALASGIAGDANAMAIVSPKVIINSPQTQITGKLTAAQIDTKELSAISAVLGDVSSGSITNPINQVWQSSATGATLLGNTVIDNRGITMNADIKTSSNPKLYSETVSISPDTGIMFSWRDYTGGTTLPPIPLDMSMSSAGILASSGKQSVSILGTSVTAENETAGTATTVAAMVSTPDGGINAGGAQSSAYIRYVHGQMDTQNLPLVMGFERIGNMVMVSFNFVTYGSTIQADQVLMNGPKVPVGFRPVDNLHIMANVNNAGNNRGTITFTIRPDGEVLQTSPAISGANRIMGSAFYMTYMIGAQSGSVVNDAMGNTVW